MKGKNDYIKPMASFSSDNKDGFYYVKNKDEVIAEFRWKTLGDDFIVSDVIDHRLPWFISKDFEDWIETRTIPKHRTFAKELLNSIGLNSNKDIIDYCKGLSLTDTFWIVKKDELSLKWNDVNLYSNEFSEVISKIAFIGGMHGQHFSTTSPELTTDGFLPKCWVKTSSGIYLKKGGTEGGYNTGMEPYSEVMASMILDYLDYNHATYTLEQFKGKTVSSCKLITDENNMMIPASRLIGFSSLTSVVDFCKDNNCLDDYYKILILDYLIVNSDRHLNNFSFILDSKSYEIKGMAPIYDNGAGMLSYFVINDKHMCIADYLEKYIPKLYNNYTREAYKALEHLGNKSNVSKLFNLELRVDSLGDLPIERIKYLEDFVSSRANKILSL